MLQFYFHGKRGEVTVHHEGIELADIEEATNEAVRPGREIARQAALKGVPPRGLIFVVDDHWQPVCRVPVDGGALRKEHAAKEGCRSGELEAP